MNRTLHSASHGSLLMRKRLCYSQNVPAGRILELSILHLAMSEITVLGTRHQIVINEVFSSSICISLLQLFSPVYFVVPHADPVKLFMWVFVKAVDMAKRFCDGAAPRIINGCLRTFVNGLQENGTLLGLENKKSPLNL